MSNNKITFFACDNGDASLIEAHGLTIMTDINYRQTAADGDNDDVSDFAPTIRKACKHDHLDVFILTHPDEDHLRGFGEIFYLGEPDDHDDDPEEGAVKVIVDEMWCSSYGADPNYTTEQSKPVLDEIKRRKKLQGKAEGEKDGNRLRILTADNTTPQELSSNVEYQVLAPTDEEADIPKAKDGEQPNSSNGSSLVIGWTITVGGRSSKVLLCGDATVEVMERLNKDCSDDELSWHILLAPHHCSRLSLGSKYIENGDEKFKWSQDALNAVNHPLSSKAHIVSSSRKFGSKHPPHPQARDKYYSILAQGSSVSEAVRDRFKVTSGKHGEKAKDIVFKFTSLGPSLAALAGPAAVISTPAAAGGGGYGDR